VSLVLPRFLAETSPSATDRGTVTHLVLQYLNFASPCDAGDLNQQIRSLVVRRMISDAQASIVDLEAIAWLMSSEVGKLLRDNAAIAQRELPLYFTAEPSLDACAPRSADPLDRMMVRGRVDVLLPLPGGSILIDYKTDAIPPEFVPARVEQYRAQVEAYRDAIQNITGVPVARAILVFIGARQIIDLGQFNATTHPDGLR
jgi:ATP-dependent helicase/nuclease subunit A